MTSIFTSRNYKKAIHRATTLLVVCALFFAQSDAYAFLAINHPVAQTAGISASSLFQNPAPLLVEKSFVETAMAPLAEPAFKIPKSVLAQFNPLADERASYHSKIYYDASGRRVLRQEFADKNYFEVYRQASGLEGGKIRGMRLAEGQNYRFHYDHVKGQEAVRIVLASAADETSKPYQAFEILENGNLGRLLETGLYQRRRFQRQRIYDYHAKTVTLNDSDNVYEKRVYELRTSGQPGRPVQYRNRTSSGEILHIRFLYNDKAKTVTCLHRNGLHYAVYQMLPRNALGPLLGIGTAKAVTQSGRILPQTTIEFSTLRRGNKVETVYIFRKSGTPGYTVRERLMEGSDGLGIMGRVLRYVAGEADLEYFYENRHGRRPASLTVFNHRTHERIRFELPEKVFDESQGRLTQTSSINPETLLGAMGHELHKFSPLRNGLIFGLSDHYQILKSYEEGHISITFLSRLLRGPPALSVELFESALNDSTQLSFRLLSSFIPFNGIPSIEVLA